MKAVLLILLLLIPTAAAVEESQENLFYRDELTLELTISSQTTVTPTAQDYSISELKANLSIFPRDSATQDVTFTTLQPQAVQHESGVVFEWPNPGTGTHSLLARATIVNSKNAPRVAASTFPAATPNAVQQFTLPTGSIDSDNEDIIRLASELAAGKTDAYEVAHALAAWTSQNVQYNLSTLTADVTEKASWVLENRQGVCDEVTVLFIALNRAVGIPARFVSGIAYTDSDLFPENWGLHGWAEVYINGEWVPFDVTYGQFGYVDPTHITLLASADPSASSTRYSWLSRNVNVQSTDLSIDTTVTAEGARSEPSIHFSVQPYEEEVGFGAYNAISVQITNNRDSYVSERVRLSQVTGAAFVHDNSAYVLLRPREEKEVHFIVQTDDALDKNFRYTFPFVVQIGSEQRKTQFSANSAGLSPLLSTLEALQAEQESTLRAEVGTRCTSADIYEDERAHINCTVRNAGNSYLENVQVCLEQCTAMNLGIGQSSNVQFTFTPTHAGRQSIPITTRYAGGTRIERVELSVLEIPHLGIAFDSVPERASFNEDLSIVFAAVQESATPAQNATISVSAGRYDTHWELAEVQGRQEFSVQGTGKMLSEGENAVRVVATYHDSRGRAYETTAQTTTVLEPLTLLQRLELALLRLSDALGSVL